VFVLSRYYSVVLTSFYIDLSKNAVHKELNRKEESRQAGGGISLHSTGADRYLIMGLQLEELQ